LNSWQLKCVARIILKGGIIAYPTEAVFGLGCDPYNVQTVLRLLHTKKRNIGQGLIVIGAEYRHLAPLIEPIDESIMEKIQHHRQQPITWLVPAPPQAPYWLTGDHTQIAVRLTTHPLAQAICRQIDQALVSTSANIHSQPPARTTLAVRHHFRNQLDYICSGAVGSLKKPTEIRDALSDRVIRPSR
jgi:L-threonylcarbamoyladenylate synthase